MPAIVDKYTVNKDFGKKNDKRFKLSEAQKKNIVQLHKQGHSQRALAKMFNVSRRLVGFIVNPEKYEQHKQARKGKTKEYYSKEKHKMYMRSHREHKKELLEGK